MCIMKRNKRPYLGLGLKVKTMHTNKLFLTESCVAPQSWLPGLTSTAPVCGALNGM